MIKSKFSLDIEDSNEKTDVDKNALKIFAKGATIRSTQNIDNTSSWQQEDPNELPSYNFRLRLNKYQIGLLKHVATTEKRSVSNMIKVILLNELTKRIT